MWFDCSCTHPICINTAFFFVYQFVFIRRSWGFEIQWNELRTKKLRGNETRPSLTLFKLRDNSVRARAHVMICFTQVTSWSASLLLNGESLWHSFLICACLIYAPPLKYLCFCFYLIGRIFPVFTSNGSHVLFTCWKETRDFILNMTEDVSQFRSFQSFIYACYASFC